MTSGIDRVLVLGADTRLGHRLASEWAPNGVIVDLISSDSVDAMARAADATYVVIVGGAGPLDLDGTGICTAENRFVDRLLAALRPGTHVVCMSSFMVYGAHTPNPLPIPDGSPASDGLADLLAELVEREHLVNSWADSGAGTATVLRSALVGGLDARSFFDRTSFGARRVRPEGRPPVQYVHVDDVVAAIRFVCDARTPGVCHLAPAGWIEPDVADALDDIRLFVKVPAAVFVRFRRLRELLWNNAQHPDGIAFATVACVIDAERLRREGFSTRHSNEEVYLLSHRPTWWSAQTARRRQDVVLGGVGAAILTSLGVGGWALRRAWRSTTGRRDPGS